MNARAEHRRHSRHTARAHQIIPDHGQVRFTLSYNGLPTLQPLNVTPSLFPGTADTDLVVGIFGLAVKSEIINWSRQALAQLRERDPYPSGAPSAPAALIGACCEHIRDEMATLLPVPPAVLDQFPVIPDGWLCWLTAPTLHQRGQ